MTKSERFQQLTCTNQVRGELRGRSVRAAGWSALASGGDFIIRLGSTAILARAILPEHFGLVMMVMAVTAIAEQLRELGLSAATVQQKEITHGQVSNLFWINTAAGTVIALIVCALSPLIAVYYHEPRLIPITCVLASNFVFGGVMVQHQALLTRQLKLGYTSAVRFSSSLLSTLLAIGLAWADYGYWALVWREVSRSIFLSVGMWLCFPWMPSLPCRRTSVRSMIGFGTHLAASNIFGSLVAGMDRFVIGRLWGAAPVAVYRQAYQLMIAPTDQLVAPLYNVAQPGLSMLQDDHDLFRRYYERILLTVCVLTMPISLFVAVYSNELARVVLGVNWLGCAPLLMILSFGTFIRQPVGSSAFVMLARGRSRAYLRFTVLHNLAFLAFLFVGAHWGTIGVAIAEVLTTWVMVFPRLRVALADSPVSIKAFFATVGRPACASVLMALFLVGIKSVSQGLSPTLALVVGGMSAPLIFVLVWLALPGGRAELVSMLDGIRGAFDRKKRRPASAEEVVPIP